MATSSPVPGTALVELGNAPIPPLGQAETVRTYACDTPQPQAPHRLEASYDQPEEGTHRQWAQCHAMGGAGGTAS
jgi:hypothetical protein